ncbi:hypothetical protein LINPERPRIM_LOCUS39260 [Linum perenne]
MRWVRRALMLSRVTMIGGGGLFLDPAGRPCGLRRVISSPSPLPPPSPSDWMRSLPMESVRWRLWESLRPLLLLCFSTSSSFFLWTPPWL